MAVAEDVYAAGSSSRAQRGIGWPVDGAGQLRSAAALIPRFGRSDGVAAVLRAVWRPLLAHAVLVGAAALIMYPALAAGELRWQDDNKYFYFPFLSRMAAALREGRLPLWEPGIFSGYPLFADGETGMLYPPNLVALRLLEPAAALVALRLLRFYLAGAFTYAYLRAVGCTRAAAVTGGLAFMCSGFVVGQVIAENLASGLAWLPLALYFVERSVRSAGWGRYGLAAFAGVALAMQALAVHVQVCVFTALAVFPYLGWRVLWRSPMKEHLLDRIGIGIGLALTMGGVAFGLAAAQILPLLDLAGRSARGHGISLSAATINSVTPFRLLTLAFPELLRRPDGSPFGYWVDWEVTVYVGLPVLLLALVAFALRRDAHVVFFALLAVGSLALSMGRYGPPWVVTVTRDLLGDHGLRSPGRFAFLWTFGVAALAGLGQDWLMRRAAVGGRERAARGGRMGWLSGAWLGIVGGVLAGGAAGLLAAAHAARLWLALHPDEAVAWLQRQYVAFDRTVRLKATPAEAYASLLQALDPARPAMRVWVLSVAGGYAVFVGWCLMRGRADGGRHAARWVLSAATAALVAGPLIGAAVQMHPLEAMTAIAPHSPATGFLRQALAPAGAAPAEKPLFRVYTGQAVYLDRSDVEPNALLPLGITEAGGYSSLNSERHTAYEWAVETSGGRMLDVWNARFFVARNRPEPLPSHELTSFHPERPLLTGNAANAGARAWFHVPAVLGENVRVVATLRDAWDAKPGDVAAWVVAEDTEGGRYTWPLRVGFEVAEATAADPAMRAQRPAEVADDPVAPLPVHSGREYGADGKTFEVRLYYAKLPLPATWTIVRLGVQAAPLSSAPNAILRLYGLGVGQPDWNVHNVLRFDRERFTPVFADDDVRVYRNETALPRTYLVPLAVTLPQAQHVKQMAERGFDPERMLLIDNAGPAPAGPVESVGTGSWYAAPSGPLEGSGGTVQTLDDAGRASRSPAGETRITRYDAGTAEIDATAPGDAWLFLGDTYDPAWRATMDGQPVPVHLANGMFRAVAVPAGAHHIQFRYRPEPLERGAAISLLTGALVLAGALAGLVGLVVRSRR